MSFIRIIIPILSTYFFTLNIRLGLHLSRILTGHSTSVDNLSSSSLRSDNGELKIVINLWAELFYVTLKSTRHISVFVHLMERRTNNGISEDEFICWGFSRRTRFFESRWRGAFRDVGNLERYIERTCDIFFVYHFYFIYIKSHHKIDKSLKQWKMIFHRSNYIFFLLLRHRIFESFITQTWSFAWRHVKSSNQIIRGQFTSENRLITVSLFTVKVIYPYAIAPWQWQNV